jgi:hypothetical protein
LSRKPIDDILPLKLKEYLSMPKESAFVVISIVQGDSIANVLKSHLESEGIPVLLKYEAAGKIYGLTIDGVGEVKILVPREYAEEAKNIIEPKDKNQT